MAICENASMAKDQLMNWYIKSFDSNRLPKWTEEHIDELLKEYFVVPRTKDIGIREHDRIEMCKKCLCNTCPDCKKNNGKCTPCNSCFGNSRPRAYCSYRTS